MLNHIGFDVIDPSTAAHLLIAMGICQMHSDELPEECLLRLPDGTILQLHKAERNPTGVRIAIEIGDPIEFRQFLERWGISYKLKDEQKPGKIGFEVEGVPFHTVLR